MVRMGLSSSLNAEEDMEVIAEAGNAEDALGAYRKHHPNLVLMDVRLPKMSGAEAVAAITREFPDACILMRSIARCSACGYILKSAMREELLRAIRQVRDSSGNLPMETVAPNQTQPVFCSQSFNFLTNNNHDE